MFSKLKTCMPMVKKQYASTLATNPPFNSFLIPSIKGLTSPCLWRNYSSQNTTSAGKYDYVVIGAGTAGCVMANRLAQKAGVSVLLLEAGRKDDYMWIHIPVGYLYCIDNPRTDWLYRTEAEAGLNGRTLNYTRGKGLGGCSSINGMIYMRGQARDYDQWAELTGDPSWQWQNVLPVFKKSEHYHKGADEFHGTGGEWRVDKQRLSWEILDKFQEAAEQTGIPRTTDFNRGNNLGCGYYEVNQKEGFRWNTAKAFLRSVKGRNGRVDVMTGCHVKRLRFANSSSGLKCVGVEFRRENTDLFAEAENETVLTAGAIGSPQILQLSGIGSAPFLRELGIPVVSDLPGVGENLQDHLQLRLAFKVQNTKTLNTMAASWYGKMGIGMEYVFSRSGPMSMSPSQLGAFAKSNPSEATPNLQYHIQPLSLDRFGEPLHSFPAFTASVCNLRPTSRGHIRIASSDPLAPPRIIPNYLTTPEDQEVAAEAISLTRRIVSAPALKPYSPEEFKPGVQYQTKEELVKAAGNIGTTIFHPIGTCKMGREDDPLAVVDTQLRVRGIAGLRVADASIMPTITSGNTNSPTIMIAERAAEFIMNSELPPQKRVLQAGKTGTVQTA